MEGIMTYVLMIAAICVFGLVAVCVMMAVVYLMMKDGASSAVRAIERFFGQGCCVSTDNHVVTVRQIVPILEIATASAEFEHGYAWLKDRRKFLGVPVPFSGKEAECRHVCVAKAGFNFKNEYCSFEFKPAGEFPLSALMRGRSYDVRVTLPGPVILSVETLDVCIEDRSSWLRFWAGLTEADRNAVLTQMFPQTRTHIERAGRPLLNDAMNRLESGLRSIMPASIKSIDFDWRENPRAFDFEIS